MNNKRVYLDINPEFDWRRSIFQLVYIKYDERYREYVEGAITKNTTYLEYLNHSGVVPPNGLLLKVSASNDEAENRMIDLLVLTLAAFALISLLLNLVTLLTEVWNDHADEISNALAAMSIANVVHIVSVILYTVFINYDNKLVNWVATMSICFANWCYLPMLVCAFIQVYTRDRYHQLISMWRIRLALLMLLLLSCVPPIPGYNELDIVLGDECATTRRVECVADYRSNIRLLMNVVPLVVFLLPFVTTALLLLITLNCHKADAKNETAESCGSFGDTAIQAMLMAIWFIVLYFPTIMLYGALGANDEVIPPRTVEETKKDFDMDLERLLGVTGMIRTALVFRLLNSSLSFYINLLCNCRFRLAFTSIICCRKLTHGGPRTAGRSRRVSQQKILESRDSSRHHLAGTGNRLTYL